MTNPADNSLGCHLYANLGCLNTERQAWHGSAIIDWIASVESANGDRVELNLVVAS